MVVIRLARGGSKHRPFFNVVRINHWVAQGAKVSDAVAKLIKEQKIAA